MLFNADTGAAFNVGCNFWISKVSLINLTVVVSLDGRQNVKMVPFDVVTSFFFFFLTAWSAIAEEPDRVSKGPWNVTFSSREVPALFYQ